MPELVVKRCGSCRATWPDWQSFVLDPGLRLLGLQAVPDLPDSNVLVFEHRCGSSVSVFASRLRHLLSTGSPERELPRLFGTEACEGHCRLIDDLASCSQPCGNARDRHLAILILDMKRGRATGLPQTS